MFEKIDRVWLDAERFKGTVHYQLALNIARETEAQRCAEGGSERPDGLVRLSDLLSIAPMSAKPGDAANEKDWAEFLADVELLRRVGATLQISADQVLTSAIEGLRPKQWQMLFWFRAWLRAINVTDQKIHKEAALFLKFADDHYSKKRSDSAKKAANARHAGMKDRKRKARAWFAENGGGAMTKDKAAAVLSEQLDVAYRTARDWLVGV